MQLYVCNYIYILHVSFLYLQKHAQLVKDLQQQGIILKDGKMKKKKEKTMSLQQFNEMTVKKPIASDDEGDCLCSFVRLVDIDNLFGQTVLPLGMLY